MRTFVVDIPENKIDQFIDSLKKIPDAKYHENYTIKASISDKMAYFFAKRDLKKGKTISLDDLKKDLGD